MDLTMGNVFAMRQLKITENFAPSQGENFLLEAVLVRQNQGEIPVTSERK